VTFAAEEEGRVGSQAEWIAVQAVIGFIHSRLSSGYSWKLR
jgi:hypothetical protein